MAPATRPQPRFEITTNAHGVVSHAGAALLAELADRLGLTAALGWQANRTASHQRRHPAAHVPRDLAVWS